MRPRKETFKRFYGSKKASRTAQLRDARNKRNDDVESSGVTDLPANYPNDNATATGSAQFIPTSTEFVESAMQRKFRLLEETNASESNASGKPTFLLLDICILSNLVEGLGCNKCLSFGSLKIEIDTEFSGLAAELSVICSACNSVNKLTTSKRCSSNTSQKAKKTALEVNTRAVFASVYSGYGFSGMEKFSAIMGMPIIHHQTFLDQSASISHAVEEAVASILQKSADAVNKAYMEIGVHPDEEGILNIAVSYDGSWMRRGHISNFGVGVVIDLLTGLVLDFKVLSRYCHACSTKQKRLKETEFSSWFQQHKDSCCKTFSGSAGAMEAEAALIIWKRSVSKHKLRYTELLSDGDAKTFQTLTENEVYGPDHILTKEECVNHVGKRMFAALSRVVTEHKAMKTTLGGKGQGKLTRNVQEKLALYYKKAIRNNSGDLAQMREAVFATLFHSVSTDNEPHHNQCPKGPDSWCFYNKALALGKQPGRHEEYVGTRLTKDIAEKILPVYQRLGDEALLQRCLKGKTQNANFRLHSVIWNKCPKAKFLNLDRVIMGVALSIIDFNYGYRGIHCVLKNLGIEPGSQTTTMVTSSDRKRLSRSSDRATAKSRHAKKMKHEARMRLEKRLEEEGGPSYEAGGFI